jgi:integrase/recombinase XerD
VVLSRDEVARLLNATTCLKHQSALSVAYGAGLRVAEVSALKVADIDSERMLLRVERGKGGQYRNAVLSADLLTQRAPEGDWIRCRSAMAPRQWSSPAFSPSGVTRYHSAPECSISWPRVWPSRTSAA